MFNLPKKPYIPYKNPTQPPNHFPLLQPRPRTVLPPLLPTPKGPYISNYQSKYIPPNITFK